MPDSTFVLITLLAYLVGSIPFGLIWSRAAGLGDVRKIGSGNIGATNVLRTGKKWVAALTLLCDLLKGTIAVLLAKAVYPDAVFAASFMVMVGHMFPIWLKGKGGKGVATYLGVLLALAPWLFLFAVSCWFAVFFASRISSLSAIVASILTPIPAWIWTDAQLALTTLLAGVLVVLRHRENIQRLLLGEESRFTGKSATQANDETET